MFAGQGITLMPWSGPSNCAKMVVMAGGGARGGGRADHVVKRVSVGAVLSVVVAGSGSGCSLADLSGLTAGSGSTSTSAGATTGSTGTGGGGEGAGPSVGSTGTTSASSVGGGGAGDGGAGSAGGGPGVGGAGAGGSAPCLPGQICELVDAFDADLDPAVWGHYGDCDRGVDAGRWAIDALVDDTGFCGEYTHTYYDVRGGTVTLAVPESTIGTIGAMTYLHLEEGEGLPLVALRHQGGRLETDAGGVLVDHGPYDADEHRWWSIREDGGEMVFLVRAAATDAGWIELRREAGVLDASAARVVIGIGTYQALAAPGRGVFDCLNVGPEDCPG